LFTYRNSRYRITGWTWLPAPKEETPSKKLQVTFEIHFERADPTPIVEALKHPLADELDDYRMYKIGIQEERERLKQEYNTWRVREGPQPLDVHFSERRTSSLISKGKVRSARVNEHHVMFVEKPIVASVGNFDGNMDPRDSFIEAMKDAISKKF
jgi:hypothetical protein